MKNLVLSREELSQIAARIAADERKGVQKEFLSMLETLTRMAEVLSLLRGDKSCFCSLPMKHSVPCIKATEIVRLLEVH